MELLTFNGYERYSEALLTDKEYAIMQKAALRANGRTAYVAFLRDGYVSVMAAKYRHRTQLMMEEASRFYVDGTCYCHPFAYRFACGPLLMCYDEDDIDHVVEYGCRCFGDQHYTDYGNHLIEKRTYDVNLESCAKGYTKDEAMAWIKKQCPYFAPLDEDLFFKSMNNPAWVVQKYNENLPNSEFFIKAGYYDFAFSSKMCKVSPKVRKNILAYLKANPNCYRSGESITKIYSKANSHLSEEEWAKRNGKKRFIKIVGEALEHLFGKAELSNIFDYLYKLGLHPEEIGAGQWGIYGMSYEKTPAEIIEYVKYLNIFAANGYDVTMFNYWHPKWLSTAKGDIAERIRQEYEPILERKKKEEEEKERAKEEKMSQSLAEFAKELGVEEYGKYVVKPLSSVEEFVRTGNELHMCVGRCGYSEKMAKRETYCFVIYQSDVPLICCEASKKSIVQIYGDHDKTDYPYFDECKLIASHYIMSRKYHGQATA